MNSVVSSVVAATVFFWGMISHGVGPAGDRPAVAERERADRPSYGNNGVAGRYAEVNGIRMYYEVYGEGEPVVVIHGNGDSIEAMTAQIDHFAKKYRVIVADSRGHGKSGLGEGELTYERMAADWAALIEELDAGPANVVGWSDGGIVGLLLAIHHPHSLNKLAAMGANLSPDPSAVHAWAPDWVREKLAVVDAKIEASDTTQDWPKIRKLLGLLVNQPDIPLSDLRKITSPVLILSGDRDIIRLEHTLSMFQNIPDAQLCILPGQTHWAPQTDPQRFNSTVERFFESAFSKPDSRDILLNVDVGF